jgi:hypothetical protein
VFITGIKRNSRTFTSDWVKLSAFSISSSNIEILKKEQETYHMDIPIKYFWKENDIVLGDLAAQKNLQTKFAKFTFVKARFCNLIIKLNIFIIPIIKNNNQIVNCSRTL